MIYDKGSRIKENQFPWYLGQKGPGRYILKIPKRLAETPVLKSPMLRNPVVFILMLYFFLLSHFLRSHSGFKCLILLASDNLEGPRQVVSSPFLDLVRGGTRLGRMVAGEPTLEMETLTGHLPLRAIHNSGAEVRCIDEGSQTSIG